jgi:flavorubredoxin
MLAEAIALGASKAGGVDVKIFHARKTHITKVVTELVDMAAIAVGPACLHSSIVADLACHLNYLRSLGIENKAVRIFGTYGWCRASLFVPVKTEEVAAGVGALEFR